MKKEKTTEIVITPLRAALTKFWIRGTSPLIMNCMSEKVKRGLLGPKGKKTTAEKATTLKHNPPEEYRDSVYRRAGNGPTRLVFPTIALKSALCNGAREVEGATKAQIGRLVRVMGETFDVYGVPQLSIMTVRQADINHTPDQRTRAILPEWCAQPTTRTIVPTISDNTLAVLMSAAGMVIGLADFRTEKGKGNYGEFALCEEKDVKAIIKNGGIKAQDAALAKPEMYDTETAELYNWWLGYREKRGM